CNNPARHLSLLCNRAPENTLPSRRRSLWLPRRLTAYTLYRPALLVLEERKANLSPTLPTSDVEVLSQCESYVEISPWPAPPLTLQIGFVGDFDLTNCNEPVTIFRYHRCQHQSLF